jgi:type III restriction enzyme
VLTLEDTPYNRYLKGIQTRQTHNGYFSIDKKTKHLVDPETGVEIRWRNRRRGCL